MIYIAEPSSKYKDEEKQQDLIDALNDAGFKIVGNLEDRGKFTYVSGLKI